MSQRAAVRRPTKSAVRLALRHYSAQLKKDWGIATLALLLPGLGNILVFYVPALLVAKLLAALPGGGMDNVAALLPYLVALGAVWMLGELVWRAAVHLLNRLITRGMERLFVDGMQHLLDRDLAFFHDNFAGSLTKKVIGYARNYEGFVNTLSVQLLAHVLPLLFTMAVLWRYSPWLIVTLSGLLVLTLALIVPLIRRRRGMVEAREVAANLVAGHLSDSITNMEAVRAFAREGLEASVHRTNVQAYMRTALRSWDYQNLRVSMVTSPFYVFTNVVGLLVAVLTGGAHGIEAVFITFNYYASATRVMWDFNGIYRSFEGQITEAAQFTELMLAPPAVADHPTPMPLAPRDASVEFKSVRFRHHDRADAHLFDNLELCIKSGEKVGLVGHSGGGKTTVTRLLLRFMDIQGGRILVGGQDIAALRQADLRAQIAYVPQDPMMFHRSLFDNIRFGRLDASDADVRDAARRAHAAEFIGALPQGYDTIVGERGVKLSGGQRQRIAIARAILKNAPILVLDEATSSLDSDSERLIQEALWTLMKERTALVIAHRLSTVQRMDRLIVLEKGHIAELGSHKELIARRGIYAKLWEQQWGGFLHDEARPSPAPSLPVAS